jgi:CSLREA domain-containing protein
MSRRPHAAALAALAVTLVAGGAALAAPTGATLTVTKTADTADGSCDADCSLREAVIAANGNPGAETIVLPAGTYTLSRPGHEDAAATGDLDLRDDLAIAGSGATGTIVDGGGLDRVFEIPEGVTVSISGVAVTQGRAVPGEGGGILNEGTLTLTDVALTENDGFNSGGISNRGSAVLANVTVSTNSSKEGTAGIVNAGTMTLENSTVSGNHGSGAVAGIENSGSLLLRNTTISNNIATVLHRPDAIETFPDSDTRLVNTILDGVCTAVFSPVAITSQGHNLESGDTCGLHATGDLRNTDPHVEPLADNGGTTQTHALEQNSPAVDAGDAACPAADQRGTSRPQGPACDIGAYERVQAPAPSLSIGDTSVTEGDSGTKSAGFTVVLSVASSTTVTVAFATADDTAAAPSDYQATSGTLTFAPGETAKTVSVLVHGDTVAEPNETFFVDLTGPSSATVGDGRAVATIIDDDQPASSGPCIVVEPAHGVDFGTAPLSRPGAGNEVTLAGTPDVTVRSCTDTAEQISVHGTDAQGGSTSWRLSDTSANPCAGGTNVFGLALDGLPLGTTDQVWDSLAAGASKTATPHLTMPCSQSDSDGTMTARIVFTASSLHTIVEAITNSEETGGFS